MRKDYVSLSSNGAAIGFLGSKKIVRSYVENANLFSFLRKNHSNKNHTQPELLFVFAAVELGRIQVSLHRAADLNPEPAPDFRRKTNKAKRKSDGRRTEK